MHPVFPFELWQTFCCRHRTRLLTFLQNENDRKEVSLCLRRFLLVVIFGLCRRPNLWGSNGYGGLVLPLGSVAPCPHPLALLSQLPNATVMARTWGIAAIRQIGLRQNPKKSSWFKTITITNVQVYVVATVFVCCQRFLNKLQLDHIFKTFIQT